MVELDVSVIIPTYRDWNDLAFCIEALSKQDFQNERFEIIIVNNDPLTLVPSNLILPNNCKVISEGKKGSYACRNAGLKICRGKIIAFTDSDCRPKPDWIKNAVSYFNENKNASRIAGKVELFYKSEQHTLAELYESVYGFNQKIAAKKGVSVTANMCTYKELFDEIGHFNESLLSGGDNEWGIRAYKAGYGIDYVESVAVLHPARASLAELVKKSRRIVGNMSSKRGLAIVKMALFLVPPVHSFWRAKSLRPIDNISVFFLKYYLNLVKIVEVVRLLFGKKPNRS